MKEFKVGDGKNWKTINPKWTIYNNTLPWSELSDKQKGKLLVANVEDIPICRVVKAWLGQDAFINNVKIGNYDVYIYRAQPKPVKPEPTMAELFIDDYRKCTVSYAFSNGAAVATQMISKGWVKK